MNMYEITWSGSRSFAVDKTAAKARYQMWLHLADLYGRKNASFAGIKSRLVMKDVPYERTNAPIAAEYWSSYVEWKR